MGEVERYFINPDKANADEEKSKIRQQELLLSNMKYRLIGELRKQGAIKISVNAFEKKDKEFIVKASFLLGSHKESEFVFKQNSLGNYIPKNIELSLDNAVPVQKVYATPTEEIEQKMTFDLSLIQAKEVGREQFEVIYPTVGIIGVMAKANLELDTVKKLCSLSAEYFGIKPEFVGDLKITYVTDDMLPEVKSEDKMFEVQKDIKNFSTHNSEEKERNQFVTLRENFIRSIEFKAQDAVKKLGFSYSKGTPKILSTDSVLEYIDTKFDGHVVVKAKTGDDIISYALPVVKNNLVIKAKLDTYKTNTEKYKDDLNKKINEDIRNSLKEDIELIQANFAKEQEALIPLIVGAKVGDLQKVIQVDKNWLPEGVEEGYELNLKGNKYKVEKQENGTTFNLVLVQ